MKTFKEKVYINHIAVDHHNIYLRVADYFLRHGVNIQFDFMQSDYKNLTYKIFQFPQGERVVLQPYMANVVPIDTTYDITSFVFNGRDFPQPNIPTGYTYCPIKQPFIDILTDDRDLKDLDYINICHEHMHALVFLAGQAGFVIQDVMDTYYHAMDLESTDSNFGRQWVLLQPYLKSLQTPTPWTQVEITRSMGDNHETLGVLTASNNGAKFSCKTLELAWKDNQHDISCIPKGQYQVKYTFSFGLLGWTYEIQNVPNRAGIRIHSANYYSQLKGCIALGNSVVDLNGDGELDVANSKLTIKAFEDFMGRKPFTLTIK